LLYIVHLISHDHYSRKTYISVFFYSIHFTITSYSLKINCSYFT
jgi:hypothetical protein